MKNIFMKNIFKAHTFQPDFGWNKQSNHDRRLELQDEIVLGIKQIKKHRNQRRNFKKKIVREW